jgi:hypothetical protein
MGQDRVNAEHRAHAHATGAIDHRIWLHRGDVPWETLSPAIASEWTTILGAAQQSSSALDSALAGSSVATWWSAAKGASIPDTVAQRIDAVRHALLM